MAAGATNQSRTATLSHALWCIDTMTNNESACALTTQTDYLDRVRELLKRAPALETSQKVTHAQYTQQIDSIYTKRTYAWLGVGTLWNSLYSYVSRDNDPDKSSQQTVTMLVATFMCAALGYVIKAKSDGQIESLRSQFQSACSATKESDLIDSLYFNLDTITQIARLIKEGDSDSSTQFLEAVRTIMQEWRDANNIQSTQDGDLTAAFGAFAINDSDTDPADAKKQSRESSPSLMNDLPFHPDMADHASEDTFQQQRPASAPPESPTLKEADDKEKSRESSPSLTQSPTAATDDLPFHPDIADHASKDTFQQQRPASAPLESPTLKEADDNAVLPPPEQFAQNPTGSGRSSTSAEEPADD